MRTQCSVRQQLRTAHTHTHMRVWKRWPHSYFTPLIQTQMNQYLWDGKLGRTTSASEPESYCSIKLLEWSNVSFFMIVVVMKCLVKCCMPEQLLLSRRALNTWSISLVWELYVPVLFNPCSHYFALIRTAHCHTTYAVSAENKWSVYITNLNIKYFKWHHIIIILPEIRDATNWN